MASRKSGTQELASRYATALFELADEVKRLDGVAQDLQALQAMLAVSDDLTRLIRSPLLSRTEQGKAIAKLAQEANFDDLTQRFLGLLAQNRRLFVAPKIISAYLMLLAERRGEHDAEVITAHPLNDGQRAALASSLDRVAGGKVRIRERVDAGLLGGLIVRFGSRQIDASLKTKLQKLQSAMKGAA